MAGRCTHRRDDLGGLIAVIALVTSAMIAIPARAAEWTTSTMAHDTRPSLALLGVTRGEGFSDRQLETIEQLLLTALDSTRQFKLIGRADINTLLSLEARKQALGCSDDACMTEIAGALGVKFVGAANVGRIGGSTVVNLRLIEVASATVVARAQQIATSDDALLAASQALADQVVQELEASGLLRSGTGSPSSIRSKRIWAWTAMIVGGCALAAATGLGLAARATDNQLHSGTHPAGDTAARQLKSANAQAIGADVLFGIGGLSAAAGVGLRVAF